MCSPLGHLGSSRVILSFCVSCLCMCGATFGAHKMLLTAAAQRNNDAMMAKQIEVEQERKMSTMKRETKATKLRGRKGGSDDAKDKSASAQHLPSPPPSHVFPSLSSIPDICHFFSTQKCVNRNKTDFATKRRKSQQNQF